MPLLLTQASCTPVLFCATLAAVSKGEDKAPILLQRECRLEFRVRGTDVITASFDDARAEAKAAGATYVDLYMRYVGHACNESARGHAGADESRKGSWYIAGDDAFYCPAGAARLEPNMEPEAKRLAA